MIFKCYYLCFDFIPEVNQEHLVKFAFLFCKKIGESSLLFFGGGLFDKWSHHQKALSRLKLKIDPTFIEFRSEAVKAEKF
jgi:hypothetical protein